MPKEFYLPSEHDIQNDILRELPRFGVFAWRNNSGMARGEYTSKKSGITKPWAIKLGIAGLPDIMGILGPRYGKHTGRCIGIEVKKPGGKTTPLQDQTLETLRSFGALAFVAYSFDDVLKELEAIK